MLKGNIFNFLQAKRSFKLATFMSYFKLSFVALTLLQSVSFDLFVKKKQ